MNGCPLPVGVVIPTLNVRTQLPAHLAQMGTWADLVKEIAGVDNLNAPGARSPLEDTLSGGDYSLGAGPCVEPWSCFGFLLSAFGLILGRRNLRLAALWQSKSTSHAF
jgi:hypothetical protein